MRIPRIVRRLLASLYQHQVQYIELRPLGDGRLDIEDVAAEHRGIECVPIESAEALQPFVDEFPTTLRDSVADLQERLAGGCIAFLVRRPRDVGDGMEVVGYNLSERGVFSAVGRRGRISPDLLFGHWGEILPQYRGQRLHLLMRAAREDYCRRNGIRATCGAIARDNQPSIRATARAGSQIVGVVRRISILRGLIVWETPWTRIERALGAREPRQEG